MIKIDALLNGIGCVCLSSGLTLAFYLAFLSTLTSPDDLPPGSDFDTSPVNPNSALDHKTALFLFFVGLIGLCLPCCFISGVFMIYSAVFDNSLAKRIVAAWTCSFVVENVMGNNGSPEKQV